MNKWILFKFYLHIYIWVSARQNLQNGMRAQRRLRSAWASAQSDQSSLSTWRKHGFSVTYWAHNEDSDQTGRMPRLIWVFLGRTCHFVGFVMRSLIYERQRLCVLVCFLTTKPRLKGGGGGGGGGGFSKKITFVPLCFIAHQAPFQKGCKQFWQSWLPLKLYAFPFNCCSCNVILHEIQVVVCFHAKHDLELLQNDFLIGFYTWLNHLFPLYIYEENSIVILTITCLYNLHEISVWVLWLRHIVAIFLVNSKRPLLQIGDL